MLIENKCVPCTWIQMMTNVCFFSSFSFFKCSGVHLSVHWELWTSCKCLCNLWSQREVWFCFLWLLFWGWNPEEADFRSCSLPGKGVEWRWPHRHASSMFRTTALCWPPGKGWDSPNDFWAFHHMAPVYPLGFWLLLHPSSCVPFSWDTLCLFRGYSLQPKPPWIHACKVSISSWIQRKHHRL